ncbi:hypothetical protein DXG03_009693 [Asterophora parasitica]|uniref:Uncharacterized protein n=1 Tax=Asterophora parasitica TaxID=117018 RepID=A0A9P7G7U6_9AGAR|nr:hypothetical protein DXG03_009693 [Asterophora parasitica]
MAQHSIITGVAGAYVVERNNDFIKMRFWARNDESVPADVKNGASSVNTDNWVRAHHFLLLVEF